MTVTAKGQITIPEELRERFALMPGTEVEFIEKSGTLSIIPREDIRKKEAAAVWLAKATGSASNGLTTGQLMAISRRED